MIKYIICSLLFVFFFLPIILFYMIEICAFLLILIANIFSKEKMKDFIIKKRNDYRIYVIDLFGL